ncbi:thioesterase II family protein [Streptomyces olivochromogenes]|uniref:Oleoyl-ACP hydrolase n=1 Tax=Streptomyces olivochromogenes TaxID=1963 RepID=A0A250VC88_STROL|nr:alpha/beta fold hydrolase [Streptomyces olivochromogenes]GAX51771.1 oleoyl-ACP hydrolase [Streptomyces olivochromogenes]
MLWTQCVDPKPFAERRLVCFPHAGGSPYFFRGWEKALGGVEVHAVCYPGRAERIAEPCATDLTAVARRIAEELLTASDGRPTALFGHSMGATVAFEVACALADAGVPASRLIVSGARAPHLMVPDAAVTWDDASVARTLVELGGTDPELLRNKAFVQLVMPYIGADFRMLAAYAGSPGRQVDCPLTALVGATDPRVPRAQAAAWEESTRGPFRLHVVPGGHFYLADEPPFGIVEEALRPLTAPGPGPGTTPRAGTPDRGTACD